MQNGYKRVTWRRIKMLLAKPIIDEKFWIVERNGEKVGTLRKTKDLVLTINQKSLKFADIKSLCDSTKIKFATGNEIEVTEDKNKEFEVHGYPCKTQPYNDIFDLKRKLPLYTKTVKSQSFYCAGYYTIGFEKGWVGALCPKLITLSKNEFKGPFYNKFEMQEVLKKL